jgi:hypothetical protein
MCVGTKREDHAFRLVKQPQLFGLGSCNLIRGYPECRIAVEVKECGQRGRENFDLAKSLAF